jgi:hypothetical protein
MGEITSLEVYMEGWHVLKLFRKEAIIDREEYRRDRGIAERIHMENWKDLFSHFQPVETIEFSDLNELNEFLGKRGYPKYYESYRDIRFGDGEIVLMLKQEYKVLRTPKYPVLLAHGELTRKVSTLKDVPIESIIFCHLPYFPRL